MKELHAVIVGGGISGLSTAYFLSQKASQEHRPLKITLLEASNRFGGILHTLTRGNLRTEAAADAFYAGYDVVDLCRELGIEEDLREAAPCFRRFFGLDDRKIFPIPGFSGSFFDAFRVLRSPRLSLFTKCRMLQEPFIPSRKEKGDESCASFFCRRLGRGFYQEIARPLIRGVYMMDPERLSLEAVFPQWLQAEQIYGSLMSAFLKKNNKKKNPEAFLTLRQGVEGLIQAFVRNLKNCKLRKTTTVRQCAYNQGWDISLENGDFLHADIVCLAMNACDSSKLLSVSVPELSRALSTLHYDSMMTVNLIYRSEDVPSRRFDPGFLVPMDGKPYPFSSLKWLGMSEDGKYLIMRAFLSQTMMPAFFCDSDEVLMRKTRAFLTDYFGIQANPLLFDVERYPKVLPQYEIGHFERVAQIEKKCLQYPGLFLSGNGFRGFGITDCVRRAKTAVSGLPFSMF